MSKLSPSLHAKVQSGDAHWVTIKEGPLEERHLLIDGPRPAVGEKSTGRILAGHKIPLHVIQKITGATSGSQLETHQTIESHVMNHLHKLRGYQKFGDVASKFLQDRVHKLFTEKGLMGEESTVKRVVVGINPTSGKYNYFAIRGDSHGDKSDAELAKYYGDLRGYSRMEWAVIHKDMEESPVYNSKGQVVDVESKKAKDAEKHGKMQEFASSLKNKLQKFGVADVVFNKESAKDSERQAVAKVAEKAFSVMSQLVPQKALTKTRIKIVLGKLEGTRSAWAYYMVHDRSITVTSKKDGMKPFYHEYGHAMDHAIGGNGFASESGVLKPLISAIRETTGHQQFINSIGKPGSHWKASGKYGLRYFQSGRETFARWFAVYVQRQAKMRNVELPSELAEGDRFEKYSDGEMIHLSRIFEDILDNNGLSKAFVLGGMLLVKKESKKEDKPKVKYSNPSKGVSHELRARVKAGDAHWITVKKGPLEGRHLLIEGPRPEPGKQSTGRILAGRGIPNHIIEKLAGTHATSVEHTQTHHDSDGNPIRETEMFHKPHQSGFSSKLGIHNADGEGFTQTSFIHGADEFNKPKHKTAEEKETERKQNAELDRKNKEFWNEQKKEPEHKAKYNVGDKVHLGQDIHGIISEADKHGFHHIHEAETGKFISVGRSPEDAVNSAISDLNVRDRRERLKEDLESVKRGQFNFDDVDRYNHLTQFETTAKKLNDRYHGVVNKATEEAKKQLARYGVNDIPSEVQDSLGRLAQAYEGVIRSEIRGREIAPPWSVTGRSNYKGNPDKAESHMRNAYGKFEHAQEMVNKAIDKYSPKRAISSDESDAVQQLEAKIAQAEEMHERMKLINSIVKKKNLTVGQKEKKLLEAGVKEKNARTFAESSGIESWQLQNNLANIKRMKERVEHLNRQRSQSTSSKEYSHGLVHDNVEDNRLQIFFDGKPDAETRQKLKLRGFRWSPSATGPNGESGAWQRFRSPEATRIANEIMSNFKKHTGLFSLDGRLLLKRR